MNISGKHVAILVNNYFEQAEFEEPISALKDAGAEVTIIGNETVDLQGLKHVRMGDKFKADILLRQASSDDYDALVIPGGVVNADKLRTDLKAQQWASEFLNSDRVLAVICHGPWLLASAGLVDDRKLTSYYTIADDIINAGGEWVDMPLVIDGNLITSRQPDDLPYFNDRLILMLGSQERSAEQDAASGNLVGKDERQTAHNHQLSSLGYRKLSKRQQRDIFGDEANDLDDEEALHPSSIVPEQEED